MVGVADQREVVLAFGARTVRTRGPSLAVTAPFLSRVRARGVGPTGKPSCSRSALARSDLVTRNQPVVWELPIVCLLARSTSRVRDM